MAMSSPRPTAAPATPTQTPVLLINLSSPGRTKALLLALVICSSQPVIHVLASNQNNIFDMVFHRFEVIIDNSKKPATVLLKGSVQDFRQMVDHR